MTSTEPYYSFAAVKRVGEGGQARLHSRILPAALRRLGYDDHETVNMAHSASVEDVEVVFLEAWRQGLNGITVYRRGSKALQPIRAPSDDDIHELPQARS